MLNYRIIDCDNHYYEPDDCFTRHIEAQHRCQTVWVKREHEDGHGIMMLGDERLSFFSVGVGDYIGPPGAMREFFKGNTDEGGQVNLNPIQLEDYPAFTNRAARERLLDEQQVEAAVMLPTLGVGVEWQLRRHPDVLYPSLRAFNRWQREEWGWGNEGRRIFCTGLISLMDVDQAIAELERLLAEGLRLVYITTGPVAGKTPADSHFDPFWARVQEAGVPVVFHIGEGGFNQMYASQWGEEATPASHRFSAFNSYIGIGERPITDTVASLIFCNLFGRFPGLRFMIVEYGSAWVEHFLGVLDKTYRLGHVQSRWRFGKPDKPSEIFRRHFSVVPFHEDDIPALASCVGHESLINGSDFPHPEGLEWPMEMAESMTGMDAGTVRDIMRNNACGLLGISP